MSDKKRKEARAGSGARGEHARHQRDHRLGRLGIEHDFARIFGMALLGPLEGHLLHGLPPSSASASASTTGELAFHPLPAPSAEAVAAVARRTAQRVRKLLEERAEEQDEAEPTEDDFGRLLTQLRRAGFGWLRPEGVRRALAKLAGAG